MVNNDWLDIAVLEDYLDGKLDAKTMNRVEREALEDPFVAEALAGLSESPHRALASISLLQRQLHERIAQQQTAKKRTVITWQRLSIASAAAVLFITAGIVFWMKQVNYQQLRNQNKQVEVVLAPKSAEKAISPVPAAVASPSDASGRATASIEKPEKLRTKTSIIAGGEDLAVNTPKSKAMVTEPPLAFSASASARTAASDTGFIRGTVVDAVTRQPMAGVSVSAKDANGNQRVIATTNVAGEYEIKKDSNIVGKDLMFSYVSFDTKTFRAKGDRLNITLAETNNDLSDKVVIRGYVKRTKDSAAGSSNVLAGKEVKDVPVGNVEQLLQGKVAGLNIMNNTGTPGKRGSLNIRGLGAMKSQPLQGWDHFYMYIANNNKFKEEPRLGKAVELAFKLKEDGTPDKVKVVKGINKKYNNEAIRLISEGPKWSPLEADSLNISFKVNF